MDKTTSGWINGFLGVLIFSGSLPATRVAVADFDPVFLTVARAAIAGALALGLLLLFRQKWPKPGEMVSLVVVALGVVVGFPLLTALALKHVTSVALRSSSSGSCRWRPPASRSCAAASGRGRPSGCFPGSAACSSPALPSCRA